MICNKCGFKNEEDSCFCEACGTMLISRDETAEDINEIQENNSLSEDQEIVRVEPIPLIAEDLDPAEVGFSWADQVNPFVVAEENSTDDNDDEVKTGCVYCTQCGHKNVSDAMFCEACGNPIADSAESSRSETSGEDRFEKMKSIVKITKDAAQETIIDVGSEIKREAGKRLAKKCCEVCGAEIGFLGKVKLMDGIICKDCFAKAGYLAGNSAMIAEAASTSVGQIRAEIDIRERNADIVQHFLPTYSPADCAQFDDDSRQMILARRTFALNSPLDFALFSYDQIIDYELLEDGEGIASGGVGRAVVGGLLFGEVGAIVGSTTRKSKPTIESMKIKLTTKGTAQPAFYLTLISSETKKTSKQYKQIMKIAQDILAKLQVITGGEQSSEPVVEVKSMPVQDAADEIRKFKALLDEGIITQEEFDAKKKILLGI